MGTIRIEPGAGNLWIKKAKAWKAVTLHPAVIAELEKVPPAERTGRLFPWGPKSAGSVYKRLEPLCAALGLEFTPHCARHLLRDQSA